MSYELSTVLNLLSFLSLVIPLAGLLALSVRSCAGARPRTFILAAAAVLSLALCLPPHEDIFTGLDNSSYRLMAEALSEGRPLTGPDEAAKLVPEELRSSLMYRPAGSRPTRDCVFQISRKTSETVPFFMPGLPMAAAGSRMTARFPLLIGAFWIILLCIRISRGRRPFAALVLSAVLILATPFPLMFSRGYFADVAGAFLACAPLLACGRKSLRNSFFSGFLAGAAISIHPVNILVAAPVIIYLVLSEEKLKHGLTLAASALAGLVPLFLITRYICHPYGDWTRLDNLRAIFASTGEHAALGAGALLLALLLVAAFAMAYCGPVRKRLSALLDRVPAPLWIAAALIPALAAPFCGNSGAIVRKGFAVFPGGYGISGLAAVVMIALAICFSRRANSLKVLFVLLCWTSVPFALIKGMEVQVGIWSFRRLAPTAIALISAGALCVSSHPAMPAAVSDFFSRLRLPRFVTTAFARNGFLAACVLLLLASFIRSPLSFIGVNEEGAVRLRDSVQKEIATADVAFFDYFPHSVPFACKSARPVYGLGTFAYSKWPEIEKWLVSTASTGRMVIATSYSPCAVEKGVILKDTAGGGVRSSLTYPKSPAVIPAKKAEREISLTVMDVVPASRAQAELADMVQRKVFDGGPMGIRGDWHYVPGRKGAWSRGNSSVIGPFAPGHVTMTLDVEWFPPSKEFDRQSIYIHTPWGNNEYAFEMPGGRYTIFLRMSYTGETAGVGEYRLVAPKPYSPAMYGQKGYPDDLGIFVHSVEIATGKSAREAEMAHRARRVREGRGEDITY